MAANALLLGVIALWLLSRRKRSHALEMKPEFEQSHQERALKGFPQQGHLILSRRSVYDAGVAPWLLVLYPLGRFIIEEFRGDSVRGLWFGGSLSTSQLISIAAFPFGLFLLWRGHQRHAAESVTP